MHLPPPQLRPCSLSLMRMSPETPVHESVTSTLGSDTLKVHGAKTEAICMESDKEETRDPLVYTVVGLSVDNIAGQETAGQLRMAWAGPGGEALQGEGRAEEASVVGE